MQLSVTRFLRARCICTTSTLSVAVVHLQMPVGMYPHPLNLPLIELFYCSVEHVYVSALLVCRMIILLLDGVAFS